MQVPLAAPAEDDVALIDAPRLRVDDLVRRWDVHANTVGLYVKRGHPSGRGRLKAFRLGGRTGALRFRLRDVLEFEDDVLAVIPDDENAVA
jgi:hypothetical protein